jgi:hypothetical protein
MRANPPNHQPTKIKISLQKHTQNKLDLAIDQ